MKEGGGAAGARGPQRVAQGDGAAVRIDLALVDAQLLDRVGRLGPKWEGSL